MDKLGRNRWIAKVCALALAFGLWSGAAVPPSAAKPYGSQQLVVLSKSRPGVMVAINGYGPFLFVVDTATSNTVLTPALIQKLGIPAMPGPPIDVITAIGRTRSVYYPLREVATSGVIVEGIKAVVVDLPGDLGVMGALGADFLANFTVDLDLRAGRMTLIPFEEDVKFANLGRVRGHLNSYGLLVVPASVDGFATDAVIDTGAESTMANASLAFSMSNPGVVYGQLNRESITDAAGMRLTSTSRSFDKVRVGPRVWRGGRLVVSDTFVFDEIGFAKKPAIFIGMDLVAGRRLVLDYRTRSLWLER